MAPTNWSEHMPLLALFGATAAYVSAIRLWFHKVRTDSLDALRKAYGPPREPYQPDHLKERLTRAVVWLRGLAIIDLTVVFGAGFVLRRAFYDWMPARCWYGDRSFDEFGLIVQIMWIAFVLLALAHAKAAFWAFTVRSRFEPNATRRREKWEMWVSAFLVGLVAVVVILYV